MSYNSLARQSTDQALIDRVTAACVKETLNNSDFGDSDFGNVVKRMPSVGGSTLIWPVSMATESEYEYALNSDHPDPGGDDTVITDAMILSAVQENWPENDTVLPVN